MNFSDFSSRGRKLDKKEKLDTKEKLVVNSFLLIMQRWGGVVG